MSTGKTACSWSWAARSCKPATTPRCARTCPPARKLIVPGFIDTHIHFPQTDMIASPSPGLLHWLETYTFPEERRFESEQYAAGVASFFLDELLRNGTTSAMVWSTVHRGSAETLFTQAQQRGMRLITG